MNDSREHLRLVLMFHISFCDKKPMYDYITVDSDGSLWTWNQPPKIETYGADGEWYWITSDTSSFLGKSMRMNGEMIYVELNGVSGEDTLFTLREIFEQD